MHIEKLSDADKAYLAQFDSIVRLSLNQTKLKSLQNLPDKVALVRIELAENQITGSELQHLNKYAETLTTLKLASNKIATFEDVKSLATLKHLKNLDLENNPITKLAGYREKMF